MPTEMVKFCTEKAVLISVYEEKPRRRRRRLTASRNHHHHRDHHHHYFLREVSAGKGYNRRAEILRYSRTLRESPTPPPPIWATASIPLGQKPTQASNNQQPTTAKTVTFQRKTSSAETPTCFSDWKVLIPSFIRSLISLKGKKKKKKQSCSGTNTIKALMKRIQGRKKWGLFPSLCSTIKL